MDENLNNNELQNNIEPQNNNYVEEPKKSNGLLIVLIILALIIIGLLSYKIFFVDKKEDNKDSSNNTKVEEKETAEKIDYEVKEEQDGEMTWKYLYVNGNKIADVKGEGVEVEQFKDVLVVNVGNPGPARSILVVDKNGNVNKLDYKDKERVGELFTYGPKGYRVDGNNLYIIEARQWGNGYIDWYCRYSDKTAVVNYEVKYEYLGNGKFSNGTVVNEKSINEVYANELKACETTIEDKVKSVSIKDSEVQKYYALVTSNEQNSAYYEVDSDLKYIINNKNAYAYDRVLKGQKIQEKPCADYIKYLGERDLCSGVNSADDESNTTPGVTIATLKSEDLKKAVETMYGKNAYKAENFALKVHTFKYIEAEDLYIEVYFAGGGTGDIYSTKLEKAEKSNNGLYIYERMSLGDKQLGLFKHTFEKNSYDNNYHYVKTERA